MLFRSLEADINITAVWGTGDVDPDKLLGVREVRAKFDIEAPGLSKDELNDLVQHATKWSPVANTYMNPVPVIASLA